MASSTDRTTQFSKTVRLAHLNRVKLEQEYLQDLLDRVLLVTNPFIVAQADELDWVFDWTPENDPLLITGDRSVIPRLEAWVAPRRSQARGRAKVKTKAMAPPEARYIVTAEDIALLLGYMRRFKQLNEDMGERIDRMRKVQQARSNRYLDDEWRRDSLRESRERKSGLRNCVSVDEV